MLVAQEFIATMTGDSRSARVCVCDREVDHLLSRTAPWTAAEAHVWHTPPTPTWLCSLPQMLWANKKVRATTVWLLVTCIHVYAHLNVQMWSHYGLTTKMISKKKTLVLAQISHVQANNRFISASVQIIRSFFCCDHCPHKIYTGALKLSHVTLKILGEGEKSNLRVKGIVSKRLSMSLNNIRDDFIFKP